MKIYMDIPNIYQGLKDKAIIIPQLQPRLQQLQPQQQLLVSYLAIV